jgi:hypothetical protein
MATSSNLNSIRGYGYIVKAKAQKQKRSLTMLTHPPTLVQLIRIRRKNQALAVYVVMGVGTGLVVQSASLRGLHNLRVMEAVVEADLTNLKVRWSTLHTQNHRECCSLLLIKLKGLNISTSMIFYWIISVRQVYVINGTYYPTYINSPM